ncbi:MAG: CppA family protein [Streptococcaceae bacterium]|jgi:catechol 2,3-dioxygenase|nr:CppA family protein [Streptococcaceae bacterium]
MVLYGIEGNERIMESILANSLFKDIAIRVLDRDKMIDFYRNVLKYRVLWEENAVVFFGVKDSKEIGLVLEESPAHRTRAVKGNPKLRVFQIQINDKNDFLATVKELKDQDIKIEFAWKNQGAMGVVLLDPENNRLGIAWSPEGIHVGIRGAEHVLLEDLLKNEEVTPVDTWTSAYIDFMRLNVPDVKAASEFYAEAFHVEFDEHHQADIITTDRPFTLALSQAQGEDLVGNVDSLWDVEFLEILVPSKAEIESLKEHFEEEKRDFFVDKAHRILTFKDLSGIEWWFTIK